MGDSERVSENENESEGGRESEWDILRERVSERE